MKFQRNPRYPDAPKDRIMEQLRLWRDSELKQSDWAMLEDAPTDKAAWAAYRQALRDLPSQNSDPEEIELPEKP